MPSSITPAKTRLFALLEGASWGTPLGGTSASVQVSFGPPLKVISRELVFLGEVTGTDEDPAALGPQQRMEERYTLVVRIEVEGRTNTAQEVDARALALAETVRSVVRGDRTLNGAVRAAIPKGPEQEEFGTQPAEGGGFGTRLSVPIDCVQRIT